MFEGSEVMGPSYRAHFAEKLLIQNGNFSNVLDTTSGKVQNNPLFQWKSPFHTVENQLLSSIWETVSFHLLFPEIPKWLRRHNVSKEQNLTVWKIICCLLAYLERASLFCVFAESCCSWTIRVPAPALLNKILEVHTVSHSAGWGALLIWLITLACLPFACWLIAVRAWDVLCM